MIHDILAQPIVLARLKGNHNLMRLAAIRYTPSPLCLMIRRKCVLEMGKTIWETFTSCQQREAKKQLFIYHKWIIRNSLVAVTRLLKVKYKCRRCQMVASCLLYDQSLITFLPEKQSWRGTLWDGAELTVSELTQSSRTHLTFSTNFERTSYLADH